MNYADTIKHGWDIHVWKPNLNFLSSLIKKLAMKMAFGRRPSTFFQKYLNFLNHFYLFFDKIKLRKNNVWNNFMAKSFFVVN